MYSVKLSNISKYETDPTTVTNVMVIFLNGTHIDNIKDKYWFLITLRAELDRIWLTQIFQKEGHSHSQFFFI